MTMTVDEVTARVIEEVQAYTMVPPENLAQTIALTNEAVDSERPGVLVECGTWMGGSSFAMLLTQRYRYGEVRKPVWMFDSFEGLPPADRRDGPMALDYQQDTTAPQYYDNCTAPLDKVIAAARHFGSTTDQARIVKGWFNESLPTWRPKLEATGIAVLRIDCDWYEPVLYVLDALAPLVAEEGSIILDDYYAWDGCALATHEFLAKHALNWRIRSMEKFYGAWMVKRPHRRPGTL
jgi:hypothetical protein